MDNPSGIAKENIYRDSQTWYSHIHGAARPVSAAHIDFCKKYAGKKILDLGCATGEYCQRLNGLGFDCRGADINKEYIELARKKGVEAYLVDERLPFKDKTFDTVIMFEVLEHLRQPDKILAEAKRVAVKNVILSVPNCKGFMDLKKDCLTFEHFLELDHVNFFTRESLSVLLSKYFGVFEIMESAPIRGWLYETGTFPNNILSLFIRKTVSILLHLCLLTPKYYSSIFAIAHIV